MPKPPTRSDSTGTDTTSEAMVGVTTAEIDSLVKGACQKAMEVLKTELLNMFSDQRASADNRTTFTVDGSEGW